MLTYGLSPRLRSTPFLKGARVYGRKVGSDRLGTFQCKRAKIYCRIFSYGGVACESTTTTIFRANFCK